ncbi:MAG TPA: LysE family transporter [Candidatus Binatia bacterium]|nr:LysE family transporter [Candidatus Binatia bacterium]
MTIYLLLLGIIIGLMVAVPVGPLGLLCVNRALSRGPLHGLFSGMGVATADALAAGISALGMTLVSDFLIGHQMVLRTVGGLFLCYLGIKIFRLRPATQVPVGDVGGLARAYATTFLLTLSNPVTLLSFVAIYAGWGISSLSGNYLGAAVLAAGVFAGSVLWWLAIAIGLVLFRDRFSHSALGWIHRISGAVITAFGIIVFLSLWESTWGIGR